MGNDEEGTLARLKFLRKTLIDPAIASRRGRIVKTTGDGVLVEFASAVDAARSSAEVQRRMAEQPGRRSNGSSFGSAFMLATSSSTTTTFLAMASTSPHRDA
jgi:class 3 adenylate cyclase